MEYTQLAEQITTLLTPLLPYLATAGREAAEAAAKRFGSAVYERAASLWEVLRPKLDSRATAREAVSDATQNAADPDVVAAFRLQLKKLLAEEPATAARLVELLGGRVSQSVVAERDSQIRDVNQQAGAAQNTEQSVSASDRSVVERVRQQGGQ